MHLVLLVYHQQSTCRDIWASFESGKNSFAGGKNHLLSRIKNQELPTSRYFQTILSFYTVDPKWHKTWEEGRCQRQQLGKWERRSCMDHPWFRPQTQINKICPSQSATGKVTALAAARAGSRSHLFLGWHCSSCISTETTWRRMWRAPGKSTRHEADRFRPQHLPWLQDYGYYCSTDNFPLPQSGLGTPPCLHRPTVFQQGLQGGINKQSHI